MKNLITLSILFLGTLFSLAQIVALEEKFPLPNDLSESSGAIFFNNRLITHNDSGNENRLFEVDTLSGEILRTVTISNATNVDWEDLSQDESHIYIGDIGNNSGDRRDLTIYKVSKSSYLNATSVSAEVINFSYFDQTNFSPKLNNTEWDAEALVSIDSDHLILVTKNWVNQVSNAYLISKTSGTHIVNPLPTSLSNAGLITGGTYHPSSGKVYLVGYSTLISPFVWILEGFSGNDIFSGNKTKIDLSSLSFEQVEAIGFADTNRCFITSESFNVSSISDFGKLIAFNTEENPAISPEPLEGVQLYPNPSSEFVNFSNLSSIESYTLYDSWGKAIRTDRPLVQNNKINIRNLIPGVYYIKLKSGRSYTFIKQ